MLDADDCLPPGAADLRAPFPWFGGKSRITAAVWRRFGRVANYVEPFFGSGAVLLGRPAPVEGAETVNDVNAWLANFWRALRADPDAVAYHADWPVSELDLHARGDWLFHRPGAAEWVERLRADPDDYDARSAGWWVWGQCCWIGSGWGPRDAGTGVHRKRPNLWRGGMGVNRKLPHLGDAGTGEDDTPRGEALRQYLRGLAARLRGVRVCCGDWTRVLGPTPTVKLGLTAVFLDPPYAVADREDVYDAGGESREVAHAVRAWCLAHGDDRRLRIALCGYEGEHDMPTSWECFAWEAKGGYGSQSADGNDNARRERVWFSPHCLRERTLFDDEEGPDR